MDSESLNKILTMLIALFLVYGIFYSVWALGLIVAINFMFGDATVAFTAKTFIGSYFICLAFGKAIILNN